MDRAGEAVDVCVCTYRRDSLELTLASVAAQTGLGDDRVRVIVADNDETPAAQADILRTAEVLGLDLTYIHAPARNISVARNACLDGARAPYLAFIDDDEVAGPVWLASLLTEARRGDWDAVLGPVQAIYSAEAPAWMRQGDFHSTRPVARGGAIETGYAGNTLLRRDFIEQADLRFDLRFGRTGGEDDDFFDRLRGAGGGIGFAPDAWVEEPVSDGRATLNWLLARTFRAGQTHGTRLVRRGPGGANRIKQAAIAAAKAAACGSAALATSVNPATRNRYITRGALHLGVLARVAGFNEIQLY
jgi:succinoglycan biosynthesis protein ExoM